MESEMKDISSKDQILEPIEGSVKDDRPLLKSESNLDESFSSSTTESILELEKKYAAYVRNDVYGTMGRGELPLTEKLLLGFALVSVVPIRIIIWDEFAVLVITLFVDFVLCFLFRIEMKMKKMMKKNEKIMLIWLGGECLLLLIVVDFLLGLCFLTRGFIGLANRIGSCLRWTILRLSKCLGCVSVQRESKSSEQKGVSGVITKRVLETQKNRTTPMMMPFPEGTTSNGDFLLPFKSVALLSKAPVLPVILRYPYQRFSPAWDSISGLRHVSLLLCQFVNYIEVIRLPTYYPSDQEKKDPKLYAHNIRKLMACEGNLVLSDIGLAAKRIYHTALNDFLQS